MIERNIEPIDYFKDIIQYMEGDEVSIVPVISNAFRLEQIFRDDAELLDMMLKHKIEYYDEAFSIDQQLTKAWASSHKYPMSDDHNLARVAQYLQVVMDEAETAKRDYLSFLNQRLVKNNLNRSGYEDVIAKFQKPTQRTTFTNLAGELDMPTVFPDGKEDPLRLLARLPLPVYITTSYFTFLEEALRLEGKEPSIQVVPWNGEENIKPEHLPKRDYEPTALKPAVYHLFGLENYPGTLALSEDDYMNFLMNSGVAKTDQNVFPPRLRDALSQSRLLLFGYHLRGWDFRTLFRFILEFRKARAAKISYTLQFMPSLEKETLDNSLLYIEKYFGEYKFKVKWINAEKFLYELSDAYQPNKG